MPTKQEMLDRIMEEIADKTLSFGCKIQRHEDEGPINIWYYNPYSGNSGQKRTVWQHELMGISEGISLAELHDIYTIIGHPVMIGDILDWVDANLVRLTKNHNIPGSFKKRFRDEVHKDWKQKRKPIENQSDDCIQFIYSLLPTK